MLVIVGLLQVVLGMRLLYGSLLRPVRAVYAFWDRVSELVVSDTLDPKAMDALMVSQGHPASGLTAEMVKSAPMSRPGGYDVIANWMQPEGFGGADMIPSGLVVLTGVLVVCSGFAVRPKPSPAA